MSSRSSGSPMQMLCCQTLHSSQPMKGRLSFGSSLPQMHRMPPSSSPSSFSSAAFSAFLLCLLLLPLAGFWAFGAGEEEALVWWPFDARPERRGSSVNG